MPAPATPDLPPAPAYRAIAAVQAWYRDPPAVKTSNLSNALEFVTEP